MRIGALDSGAHGIIVPLLYNAEDAIKLVKSAKFPPVGQRGFGSPFPMEKFSGQTTQEYLQQANESLLTIVQIETKEGLQNVGRPVLTLLNVWKLMDGGTRLMRLPKSQASMFSSSAPLISETTSAIPSSTA